MFSLFWGFVGFLVGMLMVAVFAPAPRKIPSVPTPTDHEAHDVGSGCVKFKADEVDCDGTETALNVLASKHK